VFPLLKLPLGQVETHNELYKNKDPEHDKQFVLDPEHVKHPLQGTQVVWDSEVFVYPLLQET
jgi:hypothetical protein